MEYSKPIFQNKLKELLIEFFEEIKAENWFGKEREMVSRFAFSKLVKNVGCCDEFFDSAQIGIEVRVEQNPADDINLKQKNEVCKDLIIWQKPNQTFWSNPNIPLCIMQWKHNFHVPYMQDILWLKQFTQINPSCFGIALNIDLDNERKRQLQLNATLIQSGSVTENWINM
ncbi:MAG: hypothetical protein ACXWEY_10890 [Bacteroidia bacterium]